MTRGRESLRADCSRCFALCCVAPAFSASADFAIDKPSNVPCPNLLADFRCGIHDRLRERGFPGCTAFDCFGAGQHVAQVTYGGRDWRRHPELASDMFSTFTLVRLLHELLWYLDEALALPAAAPLRDELRLAAEETGRLTGLDLNAMMAANVMAHRERVNALLTRASELARAGAGRPSGSSLRRSDLRRSDLRGADLRGATLRGADLVGRDLRGADLRGATLRGAALIGADLRGADLRLADLTGADLRAADLGGADLRTALFVTRTQLGSARGDERTALPAGLERPAHFTTRGAAAPRR